jgi:hypothetical protein
VRFTSIEDYIADLTCDHLRVHGGLVRANGIWRPVPNGMPLQNVSFVATCHVGFDHPAGYIYKLEHYLGQFMEGDRDREKKIAAQIQADMEFLQAACDNLALVLRRTGVMEVER